MLVPFWRCIPASAPTGTRLDVTRALSCPPLMRRSARSPSSGELPEPPDRNYALRGAAPARILGQGVLRYPLSLPPGGAMKRMIAVVDLRTGAVNSRPSDTRTLDLPLDFDPETAVATLDERLHALYRSSFGKDVSCVVHPRPLSWRV